MNPQSPPAEAAPLAPQGVRTELTSASTLWLLGSLLVMIAFSLSQGSAPTFAAYAIFGAAGMLVSRLLGTTSLRIFVVVYGVAAVAAVALYLYYESIYGVPYLLGGSDELLYEQFGEEFARTMGLFDYTDIRGNLVPIWHNSVGYIYTVGVLFKFSLLFGEVHTMVPRLFNALMLSLAAVGVYRLARKLELPRQMAIYCGLFAGCLPLMVYVSVQTLRDIMVTTLLVAVVNLWIPGRGRKLSILAAALLTVVCAILLVDLRRPQALVALMIGGIGFLSSDFGRRPVVWIPTVIIAVVGAVGAYLVVSAFVSTELLFLVGQSEYYNAYRVDEVGGGLSAVVFSTPPPLGWLLRTAYALASPIPEASLQLDRVWLSLGTIVHLMFVPFLFSGLGAALRKPNWWPVVGSMVLLFIGMAMFTFQGRHILQYLPFAVLLAALGYQKLEHSRPTIFLATAAAGGALAVTYLLLKL